MGMTGGTESDHATRSRGELRDCVVLAGPELEPWKCARFAWRDDTITALDRISPASALAEGACVVVPGFVNGHTHMGDSCLPDGATGLTLEEGFFRPNGFKYRELAKLSPEQHLPYVVEHLGYMARTGTVCHLDFREQGPAGAELLREASRRTGVRSIVLSQFTDAPFTETELVADARGLPEAATRELARILAVADGFSESTMNDLTSPAWREIREATTRSGKLRAIHCLENAGYRTLSLARTGAGDLARALELYDPHVVVHLTVADRVEIESLVRAGKTGIVNPRANAALGLPLPPLRDLLDAEANLMLGTDNGMLNSPNLFAEMDFAYKVAKSQYGDAVRPDPSAILRMVTSNAAAVLGSEFPGALERGMPATFCVLDFRRPHLRATRHVVASIVTRVTPEDVLATYRHGRALWRATDFDPSS
jgi:cytosine/adenosine deaminase-related metal-dependent hydrolase